MSNKTIPASTRYECTRGELTQRIGIRLQINVYYIGVIATFSSAYIAFGGNQAYIPLIIVPGAVLPLVSVMFYLWYVHNEHIIGYLSAYCAALEDISDEQEPKLCGWFNHSRPITFQKMLYGNMQVLTAKSRRLSDWGMMIGFIPSPLICFLKLIADDGQDKKYPAILLAVSACTAIILCSGLLSLSHFRQAVLIKDNYYKWFFTNKQRDHESDI